jgi:hypothetical protein
MRRLVPLFLICTLLTAGVARATTVVPPTFDALVSGANLIFVGEVTDVRGEWRNGPEGRSIVTVVTFRVGETWKGNVGVMTQLEFLGGTVGASTLVISGQPNFTIGQRDVLFVGETAQVISPLVGFMHGRMKVERDVNGVDRVRTFDGRALVNTAELGPNRAVTALAVATPMRLSDLGTAVRGRANAARPR